MPASIHLRTRVLLGDAQRAGRLQRVESAGDGAKQRNSQVAIRLKDPAVALIATRQPAAASAHRPRPLPGNGEIAVQSAPRRQPFPRCRPAAAARMAPPVQRPAGAARQSIPSPLALERPGTPSWAHRRKSSNATSKTSPAAPILIDSTALSPARRRCNICQRRQRKRRQWKRNHRTNQHRSLIRHATWASDWSDGSPTGLSKRTR